MTRLALCFLFLPLLAFGQWTRPGDIFFPGSNVTFTAIGVGHWVVSGVAGGGGGVGPPGPTGATGATGAIGPQGVPGTAGLNGTGLPTTNLLESLSSTNGYWVYSQTADGNTNAYFILTNTPVSTLAHTPTSNLMGPSLMMNGATPSWSLNGGALTNIQMTSALATICPYPPTNGEANCFGPWTAGTTTAGFQEAINSLPISLFQSQPGGGTINLLASTNPYVITTGIRVAKFPWTNIFSVTFNGPGQMAAAVVGHFGANPTNIFTCGTQHSDSSTEVNFHNFTVAYDGNDLTNAIWYNGANNNSFVGFGGIQHGEVDHMTIGKWDSMSNNWCMGLVPRPTVFDTEPHNVIALNIDCNYNNNIYVHDCEILFVGVGIHWATDHGSVLRNIFGAVGNTDAQPTNAWPVNNIYHLGAVITCDEPFGGNVWNTDAHWDFADNDFILCGPWYALSPGVATAHFSSHDQGEGGHCMSILKTNSSWTFINPRNYSGMTSAVFTSTSDYSLPMRLATSSEAHIVDFVNHTNSGPENFGGTVTFAVPPVGSAAVMTNNTAMASLGTDSMPGSNTVATMISKLAIPSGGLIVSNWVPAFNTAYSNSTSSLELYSIHFIGTLGAVSGQARAAVYINGSYLGGFGDNVPGGFPASTLYYSMEAVVPPGMWMSISNLSLGAGNSMILYAGLNNLIILKP